MTADDILIILSVIVALIGIAILIRESKAHPGRRR